MKNLFTLLFFLPFLLPVIAQDTLTVQTLTWDSTSRAGMFTFPNEDPSNWEKVLMLYNMRCHDAAVGNGNVGCREWDYSCNTFITDPEGTDSTRLFHPSHLISNFISDPGNRYRYTSQPVYTYYQYDQYDVVYAATQSEVTAKVGADEFDLPFQSGAEVAKAQFLYRASDLTSAGLTGGKISGLKMNLPDTGDPIHFLRIRLKETDKPALDPNAPETDGFTEVYFLNTSFSSNDHFFRFYDDFAWNGTDNLVVEFSFTTAPTTNITSTKAHNTGYISGLLTSGSDNSLNFEGSGSVVPPAAPLESIAEEITVSAWVYGSPDDLPANTYLFEAYNAQNQRTFNSHLPWGNSRMYWDCGNDGGNYDRIDKLAEEPEFEGKWNHWAFTKNAATGDMKMYLNGQLWHFGTAKNRAIDVDRWRIGSNANGTQHFFGKVDEFRVWNKELDEATIAAWMNRKVDDTHPDFASLVAYYPFDEGNGNTTADASSFGQTAAIDGSPGWNLTRGRDLFKNFEGVNFRPTITFVRGEYTKQANRVTALDSVQNNPNQVVTFTVVGTDLVAVDTQYLWNIDEALIIDENGTIVDFVDVPEEGNILIEQLTHYDKQPAKYEILSLVTPYGNGLNLGPEGKTFTIDVTDYAPILRGEKRMSIELGGQNQEELDIKFLFIRGTPSREVISIQNIWPFRRGYFNQILNDQFFEPRNVQLDPDGKMFKIRSSITGHQQNGEFQIRNHYINIDGGSKEFNFDVVKECSDIPIFPQGGTWLFDRAGWCPGDPTVVHEHDITGMVTPGNAVNIDYGLNGQLMDEANYLVSSQLVTYGNPNFYLDAAVVEIIRPTDQLEHARLNPACNRPMVRIRNNGSATLKSLIIEYGEKGGTKLTHRWVGELEFLETADVELPLDFLGFWSQSEDPGVFEVSIRQPNDATDEYLKNNYYKASFERPKVFDYPLQMEMRTNLRPSENTYRILDMEGNLIFERKGADMQANTVYTDDLNLGRGCYTLQLTDAADDGLYYWYWEQVGPSRGSGSLRLMRLFPSGVRLPAHSFEREFGRFIQIDFVVPETVNTLEPNELEFLSIFPNPASDRVNVAFEGFDGESFWLEVMDGAGRVVLSQKAEVTGKVSLSLDVADLPTGMYYLRLRNSKRVWTKEFVKH